MPTSVETSIIDFVRSLFEATGLFGVVITMAIESACVPLPSEIIMPLAGWLLVAEHNGGWTGIFIASFWGAVGNVLGSSLAYWIGALGGRPLIERYGRWVLISHKDLDRADRWFARYGEITAFASRLLPVVRTFVSLPAGIARMPFARFTLYTFAGAFLWCIPLTAAGYYWGPHWQTFRDKARIFDYPIAAIILVLVAWHIWCKVHELRRTGVQS